MTNSIAADASSWPFVVSPPQIQINDPKVTQAMVHARFGVISSLYVALRAKHAPAAAHSLRVAFWASAWGIKNDLRQDHLELFETVALLHEIGKIGIPDRVLQKPGKLTENEQSMMDLHTQVGLEILKSAGASRELLIAMAGIGTSFESSSNMVNGEIAPIASRLVSIVDAFDSMTAKQVYRDSVSREMALAELLRLGGTQFDPKLVRSFAEVVLGNEIDLQAAVADRWLVAIQPNERVRFFDVDQDGTNSDQQNYGSSLVNVLNDTFYRHMMNHIQNGVIFVDSEYRVLDWNMSAFKLTGKSADSVLHQYWTPQLASLRDVDGFEIDESQCPFRALMSTGKGSKQRLWVKNEELIIQVEVETVPVVNQKGALCGGAMILEDISETAELERKIVHLRERACQDQLTKVANRGELNRQLPEFVNYHQRLKQPASVIICDIDYFKKINDNFSHQAGDEALIQFAKLLSDSCRESDFVARYGGEEFVILCSQCDLKEAKSMCESIRKKLQRTPIAALRGQCITASFGVASVMPEDTDESLLGRADKGLLIAKETGRDRVVGLGDEVPNTQQNQSVPSTSWLSWFYGGSKSAIHCELIANVPHDVTLEKLKGFVREYHAVVHHVDTDKAVLDIDIKKTPIPRLPDERLGRFRMELKLSEVEIKTGARKEQTGVCTVLDVTINPLRSRDRRIDAVRSQAMRLKTALQGFIIAHDVDESIKQDIIRKIKRETEGRY